MNVRALGIGLFVVVGGFAAFLMSGRPLPSFGAKSSASASAAAKPPEELAVRVLVVKKQPLSTKLASNGTLRSNESVDLTAEVTRRLRKIHVKDGDRVKKGDLLFELDAVDLAARSTEVAVRRKALLEVEERQRKLREEGLSSKTDYDRAKADLDIASANFAVVSADLERTKIRAPFAGKLGLLRVSEGAMVGPERPLVSLEDDSRVKIDFTVPERFSPHVAVGAKFTFRAEGGSPIAASVIAIEPRLDERTRSIRLRGLSEPIDPKQGAVYAGEYVSVELEITSTTEVVLVPSPIVTPSLGGHSVYVVEDGVAKQRSVELGIRTESEVGIVKGLEPGDKVIVSNVVRVRPGSKVKISEDAP